MYCGYVVKVDKLRPHGNADRLQIATFFGNDTCVGLDIVPGEIGIYFPTDGQLSVQYCEANNLVRKKDENGNNIGGYLDPDKRNVTAVRLRGERSDGLYMPLSSLVFTGANLDDINIGDTIDIINGIEICRKYIPRGKHSDGNKAPDGNRTRKKKVPVAPLFAEHADTEQLAYNLSAFKPGDEIEITLKMHGTSQRTGYLPTIVNWIAPQLAWDILGRRFIFRIFKPTKKMIEWAENQKEPIYDWGYVTGTRRTVLDNYDGGYYGSNEFREIHSKAFEGKLHKGETVYYEVVGFTTNGTPIMSSSDNAKVNDKEFIKQYGQTTTFSYGCSPTGEKTLYGRDEDGTYSITEYDKYSDMYVYRMTLTTEEGHIVEYTPDYMRYRCEQMGIKCVPVFEKFIIPEVISVETENGDIVFDSKPVDAGQYVLNRANLYYDGPDPVGKTHVREGVVVRIVNKPKFAAYKHKNFSFKVLEGIAKAVAEAPDMEEADGLTEE